MARHATGFRIYNSLTRQLECLTTGTPGVLNWYVCGPTVYDNCHIGHARTYLSTDVMRRILQRYGNGLQVRMLMGITDVDDKIIAKARSLDTNITDVSRVYEKEFIDTLGQLNIGLPERFLRVSEHIADIITFIERLLANGMAYKADDGSVYFSITSYQCAGFTYPKLRRQSEGPDELPSASKRNPRDFVLWKAAKSDEKKVCWWDSPWGRGRPGWHIECSSMIDAVFASNIDWHSGGIDLEFPHHENEIAQSEACYGHSPWCPQFTHMGHVQLDSEKMSKSSGNTVSVRELLANYKPDDFRMLCMLTKYDQSLEFCQSRLSEASLQRRRLESLILNLSGVVRSAKGSTAQRFNEADTRMLFQIGDFSRSVEESLRDNFNWSKVTRSLFVDFAERLSAYTQEQISRAHPLVLMHAIDELQALLGVFGFNQRQEPRVSVAATSAIDEAVLFRGKIRALALKQLEAGDGDSAERTLRLCDEYRQILARSGITVQVRR